MGGKVKDLTGIRFGKLVVVGFEKFHEYPNGKRVSVWRCSCDCGGQTVVSLAGLRSGDTKSCGCLFMKYLTEREPPTRLGVAVAGFKMVLRGYKNNAHKRGITWSLSDSQFRELTQQDCHWCGAVPAMIRKVGSVRNRQHSAFVHNGVDRADNSVGYTPENCVPCCRNCNSLKRDMPLAVWNFWLFIKHQEKEQAS